MCTQVERNKGKSLLIKADNYTVIDIETTGMSIYNSEIIELSAVRVRDNIITDEYTTLVLPSKPIPPDIIKLTGITNEMVLNKPAISDILQEYIDFLGDDILLGHNINQFDINILYDTYERLYNKELQNDLIDTLRFVRYCDIDTDNYKLNTLAGYFDIVNEQEHRSLYDCRTNHFVYQKLKDSFSNNKSISKGNGKKYVVHSSEETKAIKELQEALQYVINNNALNTESVYTISNWLEEHFEYIEKYPFNEIYQAINVVLEDGIVEDSEIDKLLELFKIVLNPLSAYKSSIIENIDILDKKICVTGDFKFGTRTKIIELLESNGAKVTSAVSSKTDYVIVGELGSDNWQCGNYGSKIKKALELQQKGNPIKIYGESEFFQNTNLNR